MISSILFVFWSFLARPFIGQTAVVSARKLTATELNGIELVFF
jgi:hypothetical protein